MNDNFVPRSGHWDKLSAGQAWLNWSDDRSEPRADTGLELASSNYSLFESLSARPVSVNAATLLALQSNRS